ncbi:MAG TPA: rhodanese-like domain-containing protein [bacterium]|nr:rhodanese-like domain-containing protein [bacterium]
MPASKITAQSTMQEVLDNYPSAQRALFQRYHIGGCHSCGYEPTDVLVEVVGRHNADINEVLAFIEEAEQIDQKVKISPKEVAEALKNGHKPRLIDVRTPDEFKLAKIEGADLISEDLAQEIYSWPKETPIVFFCHHGQRSMDAASYFAGHGFVNAKSMTGGIDAWSQEVDSKVPRYEVARDMTTGRPTLRPLRTVVSQAEGCVNP